MDTRYHVHFAGELQEGHALDAVRAKLGKLFNADEATLDKLFSGQMQTIKRNCDRATAAKYKAAIEKAGARPIIKVADAQAETAAAKPPQPPEAKAAPKAQTAAEKIAALAAAAETTAAPSPRANEQTQAAATPAQQDTPADTDAAFDLAAVGSDVLRENERAVSEPVEVDTSGLALDGHTDRLAPESAPSPAAPDTDHLELGDVGDVIPTLPRQETLLDPNTDNITLAPEGGDLSDCAPAAAGEPDLDLSALDLAPAGAEVLEDQYRKRETAVAPDTTHLTLDE